MHFYVFLRAFSGAVFPCFLSCFFWCLLVILLVVFFVLFRVLFPLYSGAFFRAFFRSCPFSFLYMFPLGGGPVFCRVFFGGFWVLFPCFFPCFFSCFFFCVFFVPFIVLFFVHFFVLSRVFFSCFFFRALGGTQDKQPQYFAFWPVLFLVLFLVVTTSEDRKYTKYISFSLHLICIRITLLILIDICSYLMFIHSTIGTLSSHLPFPPSPAFFSGPLCRLVVVYKML